MAERCANCGDILTDAIHKTATGYICSTSFQNAHVVVTGESDDDAPAPAGGRMSDEEFEALAILEKVNADSVEWSRVFWPLYAEARCAREAEKWLRFGAEQKDAEIAALKAKLADAEKRADDGWEEWHKTNAEIAALKAKHG